MTEKNVIRPYCVFLAANCRVVLGLVGIEAEGTANHVLSKEFGMDIIGGCAGLDVAAILLVAIVAFPATWRNKVFGVTTGFVVVYVMNLSRILVLFLIGSKRADVFSSAHLVYAQGYMIVLATGFWFLWASTYSRYGTKNRPTIHR